MSQDEIKKYLAEIGKRGGTSRSKAKLKALKISLAKARKTKQAARLKAVESIVSYAACTPKKRKL